MAAPGRRAKPNQYESGNTHSAPAPRRGHDPDETGGANAGQAQRARDPPDHDAGIARTWQNLEKNERERTLEVPPCLSGTKWDALLAAVTEHITWLSGYPRPEWIEERARFNEPPQSFASIERAMRCAGAQELSYGTAPSLTRGTSTHEGENMGTGSHTSNAEIDGQTIMELLDELNEKLAEHDVRGEMYVVGGAAMIDP